MLSCHHAAPTVQLIFSSRVNKSKAEKYRGQILQAFESVLSSTIILEIRYESKDDLSVGHAPVITPYPEDGSSNLQLRRSFTKHSSVSSGGENLVRRLQKDSVVQVGSSNQTRWMQSDPHILTEGEIIEIGSQMDWRAEPNSGIVMANRRQETVSGEGLSSQNEELSQGGKMNNGDGRQKNIVRGKVSLAHVINQAEARSQQGGWSRHKAISIAEKLEQDNL